MTRVQMENTGGATVDALTTEAGVHAAQITFDRLLIPWGESVEITFRIETREGGFIRAHLLETSVAEEAS